MALARLRQCRDEIEGASHMADGLLVRRPLRGALARSLVVPNRLRDQPRLIVVSRNHLGLGGDALGEALLQHLGDARVQLLARALEQRLVRRLLDQRVLEGVRRRGRLAAREENFRVDQAPEPVAQGRLSVVRINALVAVAS
jgi:hypothetical protein